jgi:hypothetical protein
MTLIYEDRSSYNADTDAVGVINLRIECNPGQISALVDFLAGVEGKAGVYHASFDVDKLVPVVPVEPVIEPVQLEPVQPVEPVPVEQVVPENIGEQDAQRLQPDTNQEYTQPDMQGDVRSVAQEGPAPEVGPTDENSGVSGIAGASTETGPIAGSS